MMDQTMLGKAVSHPTRLSLLRALTPGRVASPNTLSKELELDLSVVSYHVRQLLDFGCIVLVDTRPVRGAVEHFYRATDAGSQAVGLGPVDEEIVRGGARALAAVDDYDFDLLPARREHDFDQEHFLVRARAVLEARAVSNERGVPA